MTARTLKTLLWALFGAGLTITVLRIINGPGSVVALTDLIPWGLWKGGGVVALVPIGGAGFTLAALVYVLHRKRYEPLALGAVLLGLMCYSSVVAGLTFDIGIWWRIVFPVTHWQLHSTLFEIAWCIMLYLGVLVVEFSHAVAEKRNMERLKAVLHRFGILFVIAGIALSTLHQSSLGTLFLATPYRLHPLWYTELLPVLFFITSVGLGCLTISWVALVTHRLYRAEPPTDAIAGLGRIASGALWLYLIIRFGGILGTGKAPLLFRASWDTVNFWVEVLLSALVPAVLLLWSRYRRSPAAVFWISTSAIVGMSLYRVNVAGLATVSTTHDFYLPAWTEWTVTLGILAGASLVFLFCVERFGVFRAVDEARMRGGSVPENAPGALGALVHRAPGHDIRAYSAAFVLAAGLVFGLAPDHAVFGVQPERTPVAGPRYISIENGEAVEGGTARLAIANASESPPTATQGTHLALMIDGNRNGQYVLFDHEAHVARLGDRDASCQRCHHMHMPYEKVSMCADCHRDMYLSVDIFDHQAHVAHLKGNAGCARCHTNPSKLKVRENTTACEECHRAMRPANTLIRIARDHPSTVAASYMDAMHGLCEDCHRREKAELEAPPKYFDTCIQCHGNLPSLHDERWRSHL